MKKYLSAALALTLCVGMIVPASAAGQTFTDVPQSHWANKFIDYAVDKGYFSGTGADTFSPDGTMTRAMLWTVLSRMDGYTGTAGPGDPWYQNGRDWAMANGISDGTSPDSSITREQFATMLYNFSKYIGKDADKDSTVLNQFADRSAIASYAVDAMAWAVTQGIVSGTSGSTISPNGLATRAQAAAMLMRFDQMDESSETDKPVETDYETIFRVINAPPLYPGDIIDVGDLAFIAIGSEPYGANVKAGVTYTVTCSDPSMVRIYPENSISQDEVCYGVEGLKAGTATLTAVGSDGFRGTVTITIKGDAGETTNPGTTVDWGDYAEMKQEIVSLINKERARIGLNELEVTPKVMQAAQIRANECTVLFDHTRPNGKSFNTVFKDVDLASGGRENIARGFISAQKLVNAWIASPAHYAALTGSQYNYIGIGITKGADGYNYFSALFTPKGD